MVVRTPGLRSDHQHRNDRVRRNMEVQSWRAGAHCAELRVKALATVDPRMLGGKIEIEPDRGRQRCA
jgi:hypothetical protein